VSYRVQYLERVTQKWQTMEPVFKTKLQAQKYLNQTKDRFYEYQFQIITENPA
jgi:hypothetical protein